MEGFLHKRSPAVHQRLQKRYFVLDGGLLSYYAKADSGPPKGIIPLEAVTSVFANGKSVHVDVQFRTECSREKSVE